MLPDFKTYTCTYLRFDASVQLLIGDNEFDTLNLFKDIVGKKRKYITYERLKISFRLYTANRQEISIELKNFFSYLICSVIKVNLKNKIKETWKYNREKIS